MTKRFIIAFVLLILVTAGIVGFNLFRDQAIEQFFANMPVPTVTVSTVTVEPITWTPGIETIGTVGAARGVDLTVEANGIVQSLLFSSNERVAEGRVLVRLDAAVQQADLAAARAQAALDELSLERAIELQKRGVSTDVTVDAARAAAAASAAQVDKLQAVVDQKQLRAPFSGTMGIPRVETGQYITPGTAVATLQDLDTIRADFSVPEQQLESLQIEQQVTFGKTIADMPFRGRITGIEPKVDPVSRMVSVRAEIANAEGRLTPGEFVQVRVRLPDEENVLAVPQTALVSSLYGDYVFVVKPADVGSEPAPAGGSSQPVATEVPEPPAQAESLVVRQIFVTAGRRSNGWVEVTRGLAAGDQVVTAGQNRLSNGTPVTIDNTVSPVSQPPGVATAEATGQ